MKIHIKRLHENAKLPLYQTEHAAGMDLEAWIDAKVTIKPHERAIIPTGIAVALPAGYEAQVRGRSGMAAKHGVMPANGVGTIDADYRGEWMAFLRKQDVGFSRWDAGDAILQFLIVPVHTPELEVVSTLSSTLRGEGGFGSTTQKETK